MDEAGVRAMDRGTSEGMQEKHQNIVARIGDFIAQKSSETFEDLALAAFAFQFETIAPYRRFCIGRQCTPERLRHWSEAPAVPVSAFKTMRLEAAPVVEVFRSSGTTGNQRSTHYHPFPDLYRQVIDATFADFCFPEGHTSQDMVSKKPILALIPPRSAIQDSSLGFMVDHILARFGSPTSRYAFGLQGVDVETATLWCQERSLEGQPVLILTTSFALAHWLEDLASSANILRLPEGSVLFDTGGFKGKTRELSRSELEKSIDQYLTIPPQRVVREYGMTELTSQFYNRTLRGGDREIFVGPPWLKARILDPRTLQERPPGTPGLLTIFDLANVGSALHILTQDLGTADPSGGFRLAGRASDAELRGCSLTAEELHKSL